MRFFHDGSGNYFPSSLLQNRQLRYGMKWIIWAILDFARCWFLHSYSNKVSKSKYWKKCYQCSPKKDVLKWICSSSVQHQPLICSSNNWQYFHFLIHIKLFFFNLGINFTEVEKYNLIYHRNFCILVVHGALIRGLHIRFGAHFSGYFGVHWLSHWVSVS